MRHRPRGRRTTRKPAAFRPTRSLYCIGRPSRCRKRSKRERPQQKPRPRRRTASPATRTDVPPENLVFTMYSTNPTSFAWQGDPSAPPMAADPRILGPNANVFVPMRPSANVPGTNHNYARPAPPPQQHAQQGTPMQPTASTLPGYAAPTPIACVVQGVAHPMPSTNGYSAYPAAAIPQQTRCAVRPPLLGPPVRANAVVTIGDPDPTDNAKKMWGVLYVQTEKKENKGFWIETSWRSEPFLMETVAFRVQLAGDVMDPAQEAALYPSPDTTEQAPLLEQSPESHRKVRSAKRSASKQDHIYTHIPGPYGVAQEHEMEEKVLASVSEFEELPSARCFFCWYDFCSYAAMLHADGKLYVYGDANGLTGKEQDFLTKWILTNEGEKGPYKTKILDVLRERTCFWLAWLISVPSVLALVTAVVVYLNRDPTRDEQALAQAILAGSAWFVVLAVLTCGYLVFVVPVFVCLKAFQMQAKRLFEGELRELRLQKREELICDMMGDNKGTGLRVVGHPVSTIPYRDNVATINDVLGDLPEHATPPPGSFYATFPVTRVGGGKGYVRAAEGGEKDCCRTCM